MGGKIALGGRGGTGINRAMREWSSRLNMINDGAVGGNEDRGRGVQEIGMGNGERGTRDDLRAVVQF